MGMNRREQGRRRRMTSQSNPNSFAQPAPTEQPYYDGPDSHRDYPIDRDDDDRDGSG
jgi:hypothetical protein